MQGWLRSSPWIARRSSLQALTHRAPGLAPSTPNCACMCCRLPTQGPLGQPARVCLGRSRCPPRLKDSASASRQGRPARPVTGTRAAPVAETELAVGQRCRTEPARPAAALRSAGCWRPPSSNFPGPLQIGNSPPHAAPQVQGAPVGPRSDRASMRQAARGGVSSARLWVVYKRTRVHANVWRCGNARQRGWSQPSWVHTALCAPS